MGKRRGQAPFRNRRPKYNRTKPRTKPFSDDYAHALHQMPMVKYVTEPSTQQHLLSINVEGTLVELCGTPAVTPWQRHIKEGTVALCQVKGFSLQAKKQLTVRTKGAGIKSAFVFWKKHRGIDDNGNSLRGMDADAALRKRSPWSLLYGFAWRGLALRSMLVNVVIDFLEYRIRAAVDRNLTDYTDIRYKEMTDALNSNQPAIMHKACAQLKPRPKTRTLRMKSAAGAAAANDREEGN